MIDAMLKYIEVKASLKERVLFLLFSILREDLVKQSNESSNLISSFKESNNSCIEEPIIENVPFFDGIDSSVRSKLK